MTGIPSWARVGAKVVCINRGRLHPTLIAVNEKPPMREPLTVAGVISPAKMCPVALVIDGWPNIDTDGRYEGQEIGWDIRRFRPLVTRSQEQDISEHFAGHLHHRVPEKA